MATLFCVHSLTIFRLFCVIIQVVETNEFMKRDLQEFSQAVQTDATKLVSATATTMKEKLHINVRNGGSVIYEFSISV